jgi:hypothetical protein
MTTKAALLFSLVLLTRFAQAAQIIENFIDRSHLNVGTAVWNQELGRIHPTLQVANYSGPASPIDFDVGDGSDGPFDPSTYASFSHLGDVSGNIIRLDTGVHPILNVTHFSLAAGWTLQPFGTGQLVIQSLSYVDIQGIIDCTGVSGTAAAGDTHGDGGAGRCGGANGGAGGDGGVGGFSGTTGSSSIDPAVLGGQGGNFVNNNGVGGGGGGGWNNTTIAAQDGPNASASGGLHGSSDSDSTFSLPFGAAGGGGGGGTLNGAGGGGGGGGGVVLIRAVGAVNIGSAPSSATGFVLVNGGNGGNGAVDAGPGGGGGGGSVLIYSGSTINLYNTNVSGASEAVRGAGGSNGSAAVGAAGAGGRSWLSAVTYNYVGNYSPHELAPMTAGNVEYDSLTQFIETTAIDLGVSNATISDFFLTPTSGDFTIQLAGSNDNFTVDDTGFTSDPTIVSNHRYIRMELTITTSNVNNPTMIASAVVDINGLPVNRLQAFQFQSAGCGRVEKVGTPTTNILLMLLTPLMLALLKLKSQRKLARQRR